jgi:hypothetical protein
MRCIRPHIARAALIILLLNAENEYLQNITCSQQQSLSFKHPAPGMSVAPARGVCARGSLVADISSTYVLSWS